MAQSAKNIIVGAAALFLSYGQNNNRPQVTGTAATPSASGDFMSASTAPAVAQQLRSASAYWRDLGFTNNGLEVSYEPSYSDVMVDQLLDAARLFKQSIKVTLKTEMAEGTLENLHAALGQAETYTTYTQTGSTASVTNTFDVAAGLGRLNLAAGALGDAPVERSLVAIGSAPRTLAKTMSPSASSASASSGASVTVTDATKLERVYVARRIVQVDTTAHSLKRDAATVFPVSFRCLPDSDFDIADGSEYGFVIDRVYA